jgi:hypothetical protein
VHDPWPLEDRKAMMREFIAGSAKRGTLPMLSPTHIAATFGSGKILPCEVEAEMMKHMQEGDGK